jgi:hypothetical protein
MSIEKSQAGLIATVEQDRSLCELRNLLQRGEEFDDLDACPAVYQVNGTTLQQRAKSISAELESINFRLCQSIRREIQLAAGKEKLLEWMLPWTDGERRSTETRTPREAIAVAACSDWRGKVGMGTSCSVASGPRR